MEKFIVESEDLEIEKNYFSSMTGNVIGWIDKENNKFYIVAITFLLILALIFFKIKPFKLKRHKKIRF